MSNHHHGEMAGNSSNGDNQFQVVHKRSSGQGRRGVNSAPHPRSHHGRLPQLTSSTGTGGREESAVSAAKKIHHLQQKEKSGDDIRLRPQTFRSEHYSSSSKGSSHSRSGSGGSTSSSKGQQVDHPASGGEGTTSQTHNHGHSRHRTTSNNTDTDPVVSSKGIGKDRSTNRFEKLSKLGPDNEQLSSKKTRESSPGVRSSRGSESTNEKKTHRSNATSSAPKNRGNTPQHRKGQSTQSHGLDTSVPDQKPKKVQTENHKVVDNERLAAKTNATSSKDIKRQERKDSGIGSSPSSVDPQNEHESTGSSTGDLSNDGADAIPADVLVDNHNEDDVDDQEGSGTNETDVKMDDNRIKYSREQLLVLRKSPCSLNKHKALDEIIDTSFLKTSSIATNKESSVQSAEPETETEGKRKHPTALSLIREHDVRQLPKVSLSPQRRSFHSGCSWKELSNGSGEAPPETPPSSAKEPSDSSNYFDFESPHPSLPRSNQSSFQLDPPPPSSHRHTPRVIDHVPIRDQELGRGDKRNWREKSRDNEWKGQPRRDHYHHPKDEEEPEWMEFGPNDRFEIIELRGMDEHEREREARLEVTDSPPPDSQDETEDKAIPEVDNKTTDIPTPGDIIDEDEKEEVVNVQDTVPKDDMLQAALALDNEFVLDGFDFSTGLSICQELTRDEEDEQRSSGDVQSPSEVGSVLRKVLNIGGAEDKQPTQDGGKQQRATRILGMSSRPVNALTLDEIHARENIQTASGGETPSSKPNLEDLGAFNKLVAGLQSSGVLKDSKPHQQPLSPVPRSDSPVQTPSSNNVVIKSSETATPPQNTFGNMLEKEIDFDEEVITGAHPHFHPPREREVVPPYPNPMISESNSRNLSRLEHLERMLEKLDTSHMHLFRERTDPAPNVPRVMGYGGHLPGPGYPEPRMKTKVSREHMAPNLVSNYGASRMAPQQIEQPRSMQHMEREGGYGYPDVMANDPRGDMMSVRPPPQHYVQHQHMGGSNRPSSNNWAIEMERRRVAELKQMERARIMDRGGMYEGAQHKMPMSKPNISLLPTAVMRHMHNTKPSQSLSDMTKTNSLNANRMEQELTSKASMTHSSISNMLNEPDHPPPRLPPSHMYQSQGGMGGQMRNVPSHHPMRPVSDPTAAAMMYQRYANMPAIPRGGMQNPYMY